jgi:hypothetical protein
MQISVNPKELLVLLDFKTMVLLVAINSFLYAFTIAFFASQANQYKGITLYMWGAICAALGFLATVMHSTFPVPLVRFTAAGFLIISVYFYCLGVVRFLGFEFKVQRLYYLLASGLGIISYFVFFDNTNNIGNTVAPFYAAVFYSIGCYFLWQRRHESFANSIYFMLVNFMFIALVLTVRCYAVVIYHVESSFQGNPINNGFVMALFISGYLRNVGFIVMVSQRLFLDLREAASQDFLTSIYNRRATKQLLDKEFERFQRYKNSCSLILLDIDHFKAVNDCYGHEAGDKVLKSVSAILKAQLRRTDVLGRWGGESF